MNPALFMLICILSGILVVLLLIALLWKKAPQDKAIVVTGLKKRVISGAGGVVIPIFEQCDKISLENMKVEIKTFGSLDSNGVPIDTDGVAIIKIRSEKECILQAMEQFNTGKEKETIQVIKSTVQDVLEGKLREIISKMTIEEIYKDREMFANQVESVAKADLERMGLEINTFTIRDIDDQQGYLKALGARQIAEVKKNAAVAEAEAQREQMQRTAEAKRAGREAQIIAETEIARAEKEKELKVQEYKEQEKRAQAKADLAYQVEENIVKKQVIEGLKNAELFEEQRQTEIAQQQAKKREQELEATIRKVAEADKFKIEKSSEADKYRIEQQAEAQRIEMIKRAEAEAQSIRLRGQAEAEAIKLKGEATAFAMKAEAEAMKEKAEAYKQYGEAAIVEMLTSKLPDIAKAISEPLSKTEKIVVIDNGDGGGASKVTKSVTNIVSQLPEVVNSLTGINLVDVVKGIVSKEE
nr:SPFH domain-containing protein [uncultured Niameybacter sp.]